MTYFDKSFLALTKCRIWFISIAFAVWFWQSMDAQKSDFSMIEGELIDLGVVANGNDDFAGFSGLKPAFKDVEIVMLGEQTHGEATTFETKIKLIKYLHQELGFDLLVFESGLYDCQKAWEQMQQGENIKDALGNSLFSLWATVNEFAPLIDYVTENFNTDHELKILGFDNQFTGALSKKYFLSDLTDLFSEVNPNLIQTEEWDHFSKNMVHLLNYKEDSLDNNAPESDTTFINQLIVEIEKSNSVKNSRHWVQVLRSAKAYLADFTLETDFRDRQMAENLIWLKEKYPDKKIICWGATSHFLYNSMQVRMRSPLIAVLGGNYYKRQPMMGHYIKEKYGSKVFTVGFTAFQGEYGLLYTKKISRAKRRTLEGLIGQSPHDNLFLPFNERMDLKGFKSRPLGNYYMKTDINSVMDAVVFNRNMKPPTLDTDFFLQIYPNNKYFQPKPDESSENDL